MTTLGPKLKNHYLSFSTFTYPGLYRQSLVDLPDDIREIGSLVRSNVIHRTTLAAGNVGTNADLRFGDMTQVPWWHQPDDDTLPTAAAMLAELSRRDERGFVRDRSVENKLVVTCRYVSLLIAATLKSKGIPARVRSGNAPYFGEHPKFKEVVSYDHWINQYWNEAESRWITIDIDGSWSLQADFDPYDMPDNTFDFPGRAWLDVRGGKIAADYFYNAGGERGLIVVAWSLFYDFHSLMNDENIYLHIPKIVRLHEFPKLTETQLADIDVLAELMLDPDANFEKLQEIWETRKDYRLFSGALL